MVENDRQTLAEAFDREIDPLAEYATTFDEVDIDVFGMFLKDVLESENPTESTIDSYERSIREWTEFMEVQDRHPAWLMRTTSNGSSDANWTKRGTPNERQKRSSGS
ncbi:hypothetical protein [Natrinema gari]|uniref:hypothetical protein n=1 Tax=Natrinema gari TaxID=419186 RepID=UPI0019D34C5A|nr:hypothetical protein [Natrinema gari]